MLKRLSVITTKTRRINSITKRRQTLSSIRHAMTNLPIQINHFAIQRKEKQLFPNHGLIKITKRRKKLVNAMRTARV